MPQALRQPREPEQSRLWTAVLLLFVLSCAVTIPGCASSWLSKSFLADSSLLKQTPSTVRSQSSAEPNVLPQNVGTPVEAVYRPRTSATPSVEREVANEIALGGVVPIYASGHSFVKRRARLGRPVMLPTDPETLAAVRSGSSAAEGETPKPGIARIPGTQTSALRDIGNSGELTEAMSPVRNFDFGEAGWQGLPQANDSTRLARPTNEELDTDAAIEGSAAPTSDEIIDDSTTDTSTASGSGELNPKEPGVLDRLRGLYMPRREDLPSERTRKAARRWTDPFGLLRERDPENVDAVVGDVSPLPGPVEAEITAVETPAAQIAASDSEDLLKPLIAQVEQELSEWPRLPNGTPNDEAEWRRRQTDLRMLYLIAGRAAESIRVIEALPEKEQEFWQSMMLAVDAYRRADDSAVRTEQLAETLDYVRAASRQLQPLSALKIRHLNYCNRIDGFGMFSVFPTSEFNAGQPLLLYAEIENYKSEMSPDGQYRSEFAAMIEFLREGETEPIVSRTIRLPAIEDLCATERTDYFQSYELTVPTLSPGKYTLRLRVRDQLSLQTATTDLAFEIRPFGSSQTE